MAIISVTLIGNFGTNPFYHNPIGLTKTVLAMIFFLQTIQRAEAFSLTQAAGAGLKATWNGIGYVTEKVVEGTATVAVDCIIKPIARVTGLDKAVEALFNELFVKPTMALAGLGVLYINKKILEPACAQASADYALVCKEGLWQRKDMLCFNHAALMAATCGTSYGAHVIEGQLFLASMPDPIIQRAVKLAQYALQHLTQSQLVEAAADVAFAHFILHPICLEAKEEYNANCKSPFEDMACAASATKMGAACGAELATYIKAGLLFCDSMFPGVCVLARYTKYFTG